MFEHHLISHQFRAHSLNLPHDADVAVFGGGFDETDAVVDDFRQIAGGAFRFAFAHEIMHPADDAAGALRLNAKLGERAREFVRGEGARFQFVQAARVVAGDRGERLVQLVGEGRGHFTHGHQTRGELQFFLLLAGEFFGPFACGDVDDRGHPSRVPAIGVDQWRLIDKCVETAAALAHETYLEAFARGVALHHGVMQRLGLFHFLRRPVGHRRHSADQFFGAEPDHLAERRIGVGDAACKVARTHADGQGVFHGFAESVFGAQRLLGRQPPLDQAAHRPQAP